jgi:transposase-like protein
MSERAVPYHCPFCGEEDLRPHEEPHASWACMSCRRVFTVKFAGLYAGDPTAGVGR